MLLLSSSNIVEIEPNYDEYEGKYMSEASRAYSDSEVESDDQGSIFSNLSRNNSFEFIAFEEDLS